MQYMILIHGDESGWSQMPADQQQASFEAYMKYNRDLATSGVLRSGGQLEPSHTATTLRGRGGQVEMTDGPFAETREQLGGFYLIEVENLDRALEWARRCPALMGGGVVEVRPVGTVPG